MRIRSPHKPWTHMARIIEIDEQANSMLVRLVDEAGAEGEGKVMGYTPLTSISEIKGQTVPVAIEENDWISQLHPGYTSIDSVSLSLMRMLGNPISSLYQFWMPTRTTRPMHPRTTLRCVQMSAAYLFLFI